MVILAKTRIKILKQNKFASSLKRSALHAALKHTNSYKNQAYYLSSVTNTNKEEK